MRDLEKAREWQKRAKSNIAFAKISTISQEILYEDLCYNAQQAIEKALKALCIAHEIIFPRTYDIAYLMELLDVKGITMPVKLESARILTDYAVETRYPGDYEPVDEMDYLKAVKIAEEIVDWVKNEIDTLI